MAFAPGAERAAEIQFWSGIFPVSWRQLPNAALLAGYRLDRQGQLLLDHRRHDPGSKTILGRTEAFDGVRLVAWLCEQPATARHILGRCWRQRIGPLPSARCPLLAVTWPIRETTDVCAHDTDVLSVDRFWFAVATLMAENEASISSAQPDPFPFLDRAGSASLVGGCLVVLITFFTSYSHVDLLGIHFSVNQQIGIPVLLAAVAALVGEVKLASNDRCADQGAREREARAREREARAREREANEAARERDRAARERERAARRSRIQARCLVAQCRFLLSDTALNRFQLSEALAVLMEEIKPSES
ncbi:DUF1800 domain-containing protein [Synechococcus sp. CS-1329]|uniref:DUF1800 domain-containing protein n=1 Tax=Synechococcus sp. CS-1329 TaxID=2847975 RepID=UPI00223C2FCC|nr:DUF1800 domain-containing protein [Synechococcus sp. CS-1329]MCT0219671.1 DUF1800 domain-containing protein [Synechococcus sp. CS-1329]